MNISRTCAKFATTAVSTALLAGIFLFAGTPSAQADDRARCRARVEKAEVRLDQAVRRHGERSRQAEERRHDLINEREYCWKHYHGWWDGHDHRWHEERDWDRH